MSVLEEGENASWQHLRVICNNRSLSFSEHRMFLNPPPPPFVNLYQVTGALMESWGFLRDVSNISSLEKQAFEMTRGEVEGSSVWLGTLWPLVTIW